MKHFLWLLLVIIPLGCAPVKPLVGTIPFPHKDIPLAISQFSNTEYASVFAEAVRMQRAGNFQSAAALFERCIEMDSLQPLAYYELSRLMVSMRNLPLALALASDARYLSPKDESYALHLASLFSSAGIPDSALSVLQAIRRLYPDSPAILYALSESFMERGNFSAADSVVNQLMAVAPRNEQAIFRKYQLLLVQSKFTEAGRLLLSYSGKYPENYKFHSALGEYYANFDRRKEAFDSFSRMAALKPDLPVSFLGMVRFYARNDSLNSLLPLTVSLLSDSTSAPQEKLQFLYSLVNDSLMVSRYSDYLLRSIDVAAVALPEEGAVFLVYSDFYKNKGDYVKADSYMERLTDFRKEDCALWSQRILLLGRGSDYERIRMVSSEALKYCNASLVIYLFKAMAETELRLYTDAVATVKAALPFLSTDKKLQATFYALLGSAYNGQKEYGLSDDFFRLAISLSPDDYPTLNNYSYFLSLRGQDLALAEKMILRCLEVEPDNVTYLDTYAWILFRMSRAGEAASVMEQVFLHPVKSAEVFSHYVQILYASGNVELADKLLDEMKSRFSGDASLTTYVEQIEMVRAHDNLR